MALDKVTYVDGVTVITAENLNDIQDAIIALENAPAQGLTDDMKQALLQIARKVAYIDDQGQTYYDDLYDAFYPPKTVVLITAVFDQGTTVIYDDTALDDLKQYLNVTAKYDDNTTAILPDGAYTLSGLLEAPSSTVTVAYNGLTTTFTVTVTARPTLSSISAVYTQSGTVYNIDTLDSLKTDLVVTAVYSDSSTETVQAADYTLSGTLAVGTSTITVTYGGKTDTFTVTVTDSGYLYYWDFTDSLVDRVQGVEVSGSVNVQRTDAGLVFNELTKPKHIYLHDVFDVGRSVEVDLKNISNISTANTTMLLMFGIRQSDLNWDSPWVNSVANGFGYHYASSGTNNRFGIIASNSTHWGYPSNTSVGVPSFLDGSSCTIRADVSSTGAVTIYKDGVNLNILYNNAPQTLTNAKSLFIGTPSESSSYLAFANMTVSAVRIRSLGV